MSLKEYKSPNNLQKYAIKDPEKVLEDHLYKKYGQRFSDYRKKYLSNITDGRQQVLNDYPNTVILELVNRCNLECTMCFQGFRNDAKKYTLENDIIDKIFKDFKENQLSALMLSISEPLLFKNIGQIFERAKEANIMDIFLFTNGILLNEKNINLILNSGVTRLFISVDASSEEIYNKVRIPVSERLKNNTNRLSDLENNIKNFMRLRKEYNKELPLVRTSFVSLDKNKHEIENFKSKWMNVVDSIEFQKEVSINAYSDLENKKASIVENKDYFCSEPWGQITIYSDGTVTPCCNTFGRNLSIGNIKDHSIKEIWNNEKMRKIRDEFLINKPNNICATCINNTNEKI